MILIFFLPATLNKTRTSINLKNFSGRGLNPIMKYEIQVNKIGGMSLKGTLSNTI